MKRKSTALSLRIEEVLDREFIRKVLEKKVGRDDSPTAQLLRSSCSTTIVRKGILKAFAEKPGSSMRLSDLVKHTPLELRRMATLGDKTLRWLEEYLHLLGIKLPETRSVHGMSKAAQDFLTSL